MEFLFADRDDAGKLLADAVKERYEGLSNELVLGIPRGGMVVAGHVAKALGCPLGVEFAKKIGTPFNREISMGAMADKGRAVWSLEVIREQRWMHLLGNNYGSRLEGEAMEALRQVRSQKRRYHLVKGASKQNKVAILVDDGVAMGLTTLAVVRSLKRQRVSGIILATPVIQPYAAYNLIREVDDIICLAAPEDFYSVGQFYRDFGQVSDDEVINLLCS